LSQTSPRRPRAIAKLVAQLAKEDTRLIHPSGFLPIFVCCQDKKGNQLLPFIFDKDCG